MKIRLKLADAIRTTQDEQWDKFQDELGEFNVALNEYYSVINAINNGLSTEILTYNREVFNIVDEGFDVCKSLAKFIKIKKPIRLNIEQIESESVEVLHANYNDSLGDFSIREKSHNYGRLVIHDMLCFLYKFCKDNNLDFKEQLELNDKKNDDRGYHVK